MKILKTVIALALVLAVALTAPLQAAAAGNETYVSELYVAYGKDAEAAKKVLTDKGYTPVEGNLNDGGTAYVMMGYKTTTDIRESVTDIAVMNMDGGYSFYEYEQIVEAKKNEIVEMLNKFMAVIREYRVNLQNNKPKAKVVHDILNKFVDDDSGMKLGDLFNSETLQDKYGVLRSTRAYNPNKIPDIIRIFLQGNSYLIATVESLLAIAADTADNTWVDRFAESDLDTLLDSIEAQRPDLNTETKRMQYLENVYGDTAAYLSAEAGELRAQLFDYEATGLDITTATQEQINDTFGDPEKAENDEQKAEIAANVVAWAELGAIYEFLKNYEGGNLAKGDLLDFFKEESEDDEERYYPMAASLSDGQRGGLDFVSLKTLIRYAFMDPAAFEAEVAANPVYSELTQESIYKGVNRHVFNDASTAYTDAAMRERNTANPPGQDSKWRDASVLAVGLWGLTAISCAGMYMVYTSTKIEYVQAMTRINAGQVDYVNNSLMREERGGFAIFRAAAIFFAIAATVSTIYALATTEDPELKKIPSYIIDSVTDEEGNARELVYTAAQSNRADWNGNKKLQGNDADLCADEGKQWLGLYFSKNSTAGKPVTADFKYDTKPEAAGKNGSVHLIGEQGALNLADTKYRNFSQLHSAYNTIQGLFTDEKFKAYVFYQHSNISKTYDETAGNMTATAMSSGMFAIWGFGGLVLGAVLGVLVTSFVKKKKAKA